MGPCTATPNALITVGSLVSVSSVTGADTYNGTYLSIPSVQFLGGPVYTNVVATIGSILSTGGGMPQNIRDIYNPLTNQLTVAAAQIGSKVYTNAIITIGRVVSVAGSLPAVALLFTDTAGLWSPNESTGQVSKVTAGTGDVNGVALQAGSLALAGGKAYFAAGDANNPLGLFVSNGASGGTSLIRAFAAGSGTSLSTLADFTALERQCTLCVFRQRRQPDAMDDQWQQRDAGDSRQHGRALLKHERRIPLDQFRPWSIG